MKNLAFIYVTNPTEKEAKKIAMHLLNKRLVACANIFPVKSLYRWKGDIAKEKEFVLMAKTASSNFNKVKNEVEKMHSYDVPCIVMLPAVSSNKFFEWVNKEITQE